MITKIVFHVLSTHEALCTGEAANNLISHDLFHNAVL